MKKALVWVVVFVIMSLLGVVVASSTSGYFEKLLNPSPFSYKGNTYRENQCELSSNMEQKTNGTYLFDFSGHSPSRDLKIPNNLASTTGRYGLAYQWVYPRNPPINGTDIGILAESFTIEAWLYPRTPQNPDQVTSWAGLTDTATRRLLVAADGSLLAQMTDPSLDFHSGITLPINSWTHVAFVFDSGAGTISWIVNGTLDTTSGPGYLSSWAGPFKVGGWSDSGVYSWNGRIDEFRIRRIALTAAQAAIDMNRPIRKTVGITGLAPNEDAVLTLEGNEIPNEVTADANGNAEFDTFAYGDSFLGYFTIFHNGQTSQSDLLSLRTGDEYVFVLNSSYISSNVVFWITVIAFPLATAIAYVVKRVALRKSS